ncbi:Phosphatidylcholine:ceramide cholinephosphotransferase 1 [Portunus trituberculatus]|uniref:Phosphatidylcholine:ceramide cholinephosphotransferase 1 n=1 Tax=Portunus trituberculatus TaxID=210409 RepID=A0A5B7EBT5_PORTR|nr:Phosphatidylcholine:ceramide cholinephosphotransferase 1 [Portunus trituberculatus]
MPAAHPKAGQVQEAGRTAPTRHTPTTYLPARKAAACDEWEQSEGAEYSSLVQTMVLGGGSEGGRYGSVGESGGLMGEIQYCGSGGNSRSGTSSSASSVVDDSDHCHMTHDVYQRQPLLANHDSYINANGVSKDGGGGMVKIPIPSPHRDEPRFPKEKFKTLLAFLFLFSNWIFTTASLALTHERVPNYKPLPDVTLDAVTTQEWGLDVSEIIIMITVYLCVMVLLFHKHRLVRTSVCY